MRASGGRRGILIAATLAVGAAPARADDGWLLSSIPIAEMSLANMPVASGANSFAFAEYALATGEDAAAFGYASLAAGANAFAFGQFSLVSGNNSVAFGVEAQATGANSSALGNLAQAAGNNSTAFGVLSRASGDNAVALGNQAQTVGSNSTAMGSQARALAANSTAIGNQAVATGYNSVSIGSGSVASEANTVSVGAPGNERRITNLAAGVDPSDAVNMQQFQDGMTSLNSRIDDVDSHARRGIAADAALAPLIMPSAAGRTTLSLSSGFYRGATAVGIGIAHRFDFSLPTVIYGSYANADGIESVGRIGLAVEF
jgi:trimeric autotransporter adhesin